MMRPMSSVFCEHQLLHCQTIEQCMILNAGVRKRGRRGLIKCGQGDRGVGKGVIFCGRPLWTTTWAITPPPWPLENWRKCKEEQQKCNGTLIKMSSRYLLRYGPPRISCEERLKRSGLPTLESYNPSVQNYQWERSTTICTLQWTYSSYILTCLHLT